MRVFPGTDSKKVYNFSASDCNVNQKNMVSKSLKKNLPLVKAKEYKFYGTKWEAFRGRLDQKEEKPV